MEKDEKNKGNRVKIGQLKQIVNGPIRYGTRKREIWNK